MPGGRSRAMPIAAHPPPPAARLDSPVVIHRKAAILLQSRLLNSSPSPGDTRIRRFRRTFAAVSLVLVWAGTGVARGQGGPALFAKYCYECHGNGEKSWHIALDEMLNAD